MRIISFLAVLMLLPAPVFSEVTFGEKTSDFALVSVEKNLANPSVPTHFVFFNALEGSQRAGTLIFRCKDNTTEVYYTAAQFEFFGMGETPKIKSRFASENESVALAASGSDGMGDAAFIKNPIGFIVKIVEEKEVVLSGSYYSGSFTALFKADEMVIDAIYGMAETCQWADRLPKRDVVSKNLEEVGDSDKVKDSDLEGDLKIIIDKYGVAAVKAAISKY